jgi:hypothetical protein
MPRAASAPAAHNRSSTFDVKEVFWNSPPECPSPVKSKRRTAMPSAVSRCAIRRAAAMSLPQVKQWAKSAVARCGPSGRSSRAARSCPECPAKVKRSVGMGGLRHLSRLPRMVLHAVHGNRTETAFTGTCGAGYPRDLSRRARDPSFILAEKLRGRPARAGGRAPDCSHEQSHALHRRRMGKAGISRPDVPASPPQPFISAASKG